jgi:hypothetical protein
VICYGCRAKIAKARRVCQYCGGVAFWHGQNPRVIPPLEPGPGDGVAGLAVLLRGPKAATALRNRRRDAPREPDRANDPANAPSEDGD